MRELVIGGLLAVICLGARAPSTVSDYSIRAVPATDVRMEDEFWRPRIDVNRTVTLPHILKQNEATGRVRNFAKASGKVEGPFEGRRYNDTDVYKAIEAASYSLAIAPDPELDAVLDKLIALIAAAQEPDGYLYTARTVDPETMVPGAGPRRWSWLHTSHELYNAGHLYEAAVAHFEATGKRALLDVAIRNADLVCRVFGPEGRRDAPGHQEIELALVKLYRVTGHRRYLEQVRFFLEQRGRPHTTPPHRFADKDPFAIYNDLEYRQDHAPVVSQRRAIGHAVRATYLYSGMTDAAVLLGNDAYARAVDALWRDVISKRVYVTGGLGSQGRTEAFGDDYELPNARAYAETCASIGGILWYQRMFLRHGDASYIDVLERTLYNGFLSGVSATGDMFFYQNPLESDGTPERTPYFDVACCPANLARLMGQLPGLTYATSADAIYVNLFIGSTATATVGGVPVRIAQHTRYPWDGRVAIVVTPERPADFTINLRIPGWARNEAMPSDLYRFARTSDERHAVSVNGTASTTPTDRGYVRLQRRWQPGDRIELVFPMPVRRLLAHDGIADNRGKAAFQRGPLVYAFEAIDNGGRVRDVVIPIDASVTHEFRRDLLNGVGVISATAAGNGGSSRPAKAVPYFAWGNRGKGEMVVWVGAGVGAK
jgi:DUF1680 family protein